MRYNLIRQATGELVYSYESESEIQFDGEWGTSAFAQVLVPDPPTEQTPVQTVYGGRRRLTKLEFVGLLGDGFGGILAAAKSSVEIEGFIKMIDLATPDQDGYSIILDDPRLVAGLSTLEPVLVSMGAVAEGWAEGVING